MAAGALALVLASSLGASPAGIEPGRSWRLSNRTFQAGLAGWSSASSSGQTWLFASNGPTGARPSVVAAVPTGGWAELSRVTPLQRPTPGVSEKLELGVWVHLGSDCTAGRVVLRLESLGSSGTTRIAESPSLDVTSAPRGRWLWLSTRPYAGLGARVRPGDDRVRLVLRVEANGTVHLDDPSIGRYERSLHPLSDPGFESGGLLARHWSSTGAAARGSVGAGSYRGRRALELTGPGAASASQRVATGSLRAPSGALEVQAGAWVLLESDALLPSVSDPTQRVELRLLAWDEALPLASAVEVARGEWLPTAAERGRWTWLETGSSTPLPWTTTRVLVEVAKTFPGTARIDEVELGERDAVHGTPPRLALASYVGRYRSPAFPGATTSPLDPRQIWRNWCWIDPPACDPGETRFSHNPDCATSSGCLRPNGRRDLAVSTEGGLDVLPLVGAYDSRDPDLLRYHCDLARALGLDGFVFGWQGRELAQQVAAGGGEPINDQTLEALLDVADDPAVDLKLAVMYEPKVHFLGWVSGEPTKAQKVAGIQRDLVHLVSVHGRRRSFLRRDGRPVIFVYRNNVCDPSGVQCLSDADWLAIAAHVESVTGQAPCLIADRPPSGSSPFSGASRWQLVAREFLRYRTWSDARAGSPTLPLPGAALLAAHAAATNALGAAWAAEADAERFSVALAWPGFDDSGVAGWSGGNLTGEDGSPLCLRVADDLGGSFLATTLRAAHDSGAEWLQVATWNDWNELTQIEPQWNAGYVQAILGGGLPTRTQLEEVFGRALEVQAAVRGFKNAAPTSATGRLALHQAAAAYLLAARHDSGVVEYD